MEAQLIKLRQLRLDEDGGLFRVNAAGKVVQRHFKDVVAHFFRIVGIVGQSLRIGQHDVDFIKFARILQQNALFERSGEVSDVQLTRGAIPGQNDIAHNVLRMPSGQGHQERSLHA